MPAMNMSRLDFRVSSATVHWSSVEAHFAIVHIEDPCIVGHADQVDTGQVVSRHKRLAICRRGVESEPTVEAILITAKEAAPSQVRVVGMQAELAHRSRCSRPVRSDGPVNRVDISVVRGDHITINGITAGMDNVRAHEKSLPILENSGIILQIAVRTQLVFFRHPAGNALPGVTVGEGRVIRLEEDCLKTAVDMSWIRFRWRAGEIDRGDHGSSIRGEGPPLGNSIIASHDYPYTSCPSSIDLIGASSYRIIGYGRW
ncbi:uncharacterized protein N7487_012195 [Penicillium crustosum]|uniref:uncharacterized protein n=1 Tax=Penicillium crustosum TaxID=36656 RepID=UPI00239B583C|nr:uncharacterized protein N7487_012195 [Penicillium crustosum]KAJ5394554.1 hypothetical protein N7487_012195 [Penicillium crustosum]